MIGFDWDPQKAQANRDKHGVSFEEAKSVFFDEYALQFFDDEHSAEEERFIMLGLSHALRVLVVCHCERSAGSTHLSSGIARPQSHCAVGWKGAGDKRAVGTLSERDAASEQRSGSLRARAGAAVTALLVGHVVTPHSLLAPCHAGPGAR